MSDPSTKGVASYQPGASPQEWSDPTQRRAENSIAYIGHLFMATRLRSFFRAAS